ncbi:MAG: hypothetical protein MZV64_59755 [Ignavibacteriales bacterium]|nr:hypothetical protein [Ignavibacteriales bacterium]
MAAEASPTSRSFVPCVRERSSGESWSASRVEPPTKQKFQPTPSRKSAIPSGRTSGESGAVMHESNNVAEPIRIILPRPQRSNSQPEMIEGAYMPNVCAEITE